MEEINLFKILEKISFYNPNRLLKMEGFLLNGQTREFLEIIIYKGFISSTTHKIEIEAKSQLSNLIIFFLITYYIKLI